MLTKMLPHKTLTQLIYLAVLVFLPFISFAQNYPQNYFRSPLDIPLKLAGNFGEIRSNHFHSGLDIKTDSVEGKNVYAVADGYVVRIKVSAFGYGNALYINHPNGYTSVYGHLQRFSDSIAQYVYQKQLEKQSFEVELFPDSNQFVFKQGEIIALSGNSGGSAGPHLHFELRDTKTEMIINPMLFGYAIQDTLPPKLTALCIYEGKNFIGVDSSFAIYDTTKTNFRNLFIADTLIVNKNVQFGYAAVDYSNEGVNKLGIYSVDFLVNDSVSWSYHFETFAFNESRYVNAHIDYAQKVLNKTIYERCYRLPGDSFSVYLPPTPIPEKIYKTNKVYKAQLILKDYANNTTILNFHFKTSRKKSPPEKKNKSWVALKFNQPYNLKTKDFLLQLSDKSLYDNIYLKYHVTPKIKGLYSATHNINDNTIPLQSAATISIKANLKTQTEQDKALIVLVDDKGGFTNIGGMYKNNSVSALIKTLGSYAVAVDSDPPNVIFINADKLFRPADTLQFMIKDELSGISTYSVTVNDVKVIPVYDAKNDLLKVPCVSFPIGNVEVKVVVTDVKNNVFNFKNKLQIQVFKPPHNE